MYIVFQPGFESGSFGTIKIKPLLTILRLTSKLSKWSTPWPPYFLPKWPLMFFISCFYPESSQAPFGTNKMTPHLTILCLISKLSKWRSLWPRLYLPRWPPEWYTSIFYPKLSQAPFGTNKMTPHLTILRIISNLSKWRSHWRPLFLPRWPSVWCTSLFNSESSQETFGTIKMTPNFAILRLLSIL